MAGLKPNCIGEWAWIGACSVGTSHIKAGSECQDRAACLELKGHSSSALIAVVSDGAGTAKYSTLGSKIATRTFAMSAAGHLRLDGAGREVTIDLVRTWVDEIRDKIGLSASLKGCEPREFAATLVAAIVLKQCAYVVHIGDGACVVRRESRSEWEVPSWPSHGEYASSTYFITDDPEPHLQFQVISEPLSEVALFSDGLERLALDFTALRASEKFFDPMFAPISVEKVGRNRKLSKTLRDFLDSPKITDRTDDDKSLLLARRVTK